MAVFEVTRTLAVSPAQLLTIIADTSTWGDWFMMHESFVEAPPEHLTVNSRMVQNIRMLGMSHKLELTVTAFKPPLRLTISGNSAAGVTCEFDFGIERTPGGCELTIAGDFSGPVLAGQLGQVIEKDAKAQLTTSMSKLAALSDSAA